MQPYLEVVKDNLCESELAIRNDLSIEHRCPREGSMPRCRRRRRVFTERDRDNRSLFRLIVYLWGRARAGWLAETNDEIEFRVHARFMLYSESNQCRVKICPIQGWSTPTGHVDRELLLNINTRKYILIVSGVNSTEVFDKLWSSKIRAVRDKIAHKSRSLRHRLKYSAW